MPGIDFSDVELQIKASHDAKLIARRLAELTKAVDLLTDAIIYSGGEERARYVLDMISERDDAVSSPVSKNSENQNDQ